jgi:hypothetical protein
MEVPEIRPHTTPPVWRIRLFWKQRIIRGRVYVFYKLHLMLLVKYMLKEALLIAFKTTAEAYA